MDNPKVLVLIPTYNRLNFFKVAFESVLNQTYKNLKIIISDDSTNEDTANFVKPYLEKFPNITYFRNQGFNADDNWNFLRQQQINDTECEFVNWIMDDDVWHPKKIEIMVNLFLNHPSVSLVTSARHMIDSEGKIIRTLSRGNKITKIPGNNAGKSIFMADNYIGEPTTALIRKSCLRNGDVCFTDEEKGFASLVDVSTWLSVLSRGDLIIYPEPLSALRVHDVRGSAIPDVPIMWQIDYCRLLWESWNKKIFLKTEDDLREAILAWFIRASNIMLKAHRQKHKSAVLSELEIVFSETAKALSNNYEMNYNFKSQRVSF